MAKLSEELKRLLALVGSDLTDEQATKLGKAEAPDDIIEIIDSLANSGITEFKNKIKREVLDEEDSHFDLLEETIGKDRIAKIKNARGKEKHTLLKKGFDDILKEKIDAEKALKVAKKDGDKEETRELQEKIAKLEEIAENYNSLKNDFESLKTEKEGLSNELRKAKNDAYEIKLDNFLGGVDEIKTDFKSKYGKHAIKKALEVDFQQNGLKLDIESGQILKEDGTAITKAGKALNFETYMPDFLNRNIEFKKLADTQQTTAVMTTATQQNNNLTPSQLRIMELAKKNSGE